MAGLLTAQLQCVTGGSRIVFILGTLALQNRKIIEMSDHFSVDVKVSWLGNLFCCFVLWLLLCEKAI